MKFKKLKKISEVVALVVPVLTMSIASGAQAETSKYRFSDQYQEKRQAVFNDDRVPSVLTEKAKLNKKNRNGKSKYRFSQKIHKQPSQIGSSKYLSKTVASKFKYRNGNTSKYRFINRS